MFAATPTGAGEPIHELNTTPLIDVMLVLLIMFIITIPIQTHSVDIEVPRAGDPPPVRNDRNKLAIDADGTIRWNGVAVEMLQLRGALLESGRMPRPPELHVEPHAEARYQVVDEVLAVVKAADVQAMGFVGNERYRDF